MRPVQPRQQGESGADAASQDDPVLKVRLLAPPLRCSTCGLDTHTSTDCLLAAVSPSALIRTASLPGVAGCGHYRTLSLLLFAEGPSPRGNCGGAASSSGSLLAEESVWQALPTPQLLSDQQLQEALHAEAGGTQRDITPRVQRAFRHDPVLLRFASAPPDAATQEAFTRWAGKLAGHVSDFPPPLPTCGELSTCLPGWHAAPERTAPLAAM